MRDILRILEPLFAVNTPDVQMERDALSLALLAQYLRAGQENRLPSQPLPVPLLKVRAFLEVHFAQPITNSDLAEEGHISSAHLIRLFRKHLGQTPMEAVWNRRMEEGEQLLRHTGLTIAEVAYACGFQTPDHFSRRMKSRTGKSPRTFRQQAWSE
jgi:AraC family transcriptional regulator of arabinose operon